MDGYGIYSGGEGEIVEKKSTFIGAVAPAYSEEEALSYIEAKKKEHYKARHNCFAYVIGDGDELIRSSDDGEPSGTAGRPILDVLQGKCLHNAVVVVTRYFGGVLLGTGGLVRAYTKAAEEGVAACRLMKRQQVYPMRLTVDYNTFGKIQYYLRENDIAISDVSYDSEVTFVAMVAPDQKEAVEKEMTDITRGQRLPHWEDPCVITEPL